MKSLLIVSVPKTGSSTLQSILADSLHFHNADEPLNPEREPRIPFQQLGTDHTDLIKEILEPMTSDHVVKDVSQTHFVHEHLDWLRDRFHVVFLFREIEDVLKSFCLRKTNWRGVPKALQLLRSMSKEHDIPVLEFEDYLWSPEKVQNLVHDLYGIQIEDYRERGFRRWRFSRSKEYFHKDIPIVPHDRALGYWSRIRTFEDIDPKRDMSRQTESATEIPRRISSLVQENGVLDFGCGVGRLLNDFSQNDISKNWNLTGFDLPNLIELCKSNVSDPSIRLLSDWHEVRKSQKDVIVASLVLQHLPVDVLRERLEQFSKITKYLYVISRDWNDWSIHESMDDFLENSGWKMRDEYTTWGTGMHRHFERLYTTQSDVPLTVLNVKREFDPPPPESKSAEVISSAITAPLYDHLQRCGSPSLQADWLINRRLAIEERNKRQIHLQCKPLYLDVELNNMCNLYCEFCSCVHGHVRKATSPKAKLTREEIDHISHLFKYAEIMETSKAGEPFLTPDLFIYTLEKVREVNPFVIIQTVTNGTILTEKIIEELIRYRLDHMYVSISGHNRENYKIVMGGDMFDKAVDNLALMQRIKREHQSKEPFLHFNTQLSKYCDPLKILDLASKYGVIEVNFVKTQMSGGNTRFAGSPYQDYMSEAEIHDKMEGIVEKANQIGISINFPGWGKHHFRIVGSSESFYYPHITKYFDLDLTCPTDAPWFRFCTAMRGVQPCCWSGKFDTWDDKPFENIWNGSHLKQLRRLFIEGTYPSVCHCRY